MALINDAYLDDVAEEQGFVFETVAENNQIDLIDFITKYMTSEYKGHIDNRDAWYANQLYEEQLDYLSKQYKFKKTNKKYDEVLAKWVGEFYAYLQAYKQVPSKTLIVRIPANKIYAMASGLHDIDMDLAVKKVGDTI